MIKKLVSGGQTGVDCAALDVALDLGIPCGGWCPKGRWAENGEIPAKYPLVETPSDDVAQRTEWNARDSDGTLVIAEGGTVGGTTLTVEMARRYGKPVLVIDLLKDAAHAPETIAAWVRENKIAVLNVAGPRESTTPGVNKKAKALLSRTLRRAS
jgi:hypothetical protein